MGLGLHVVRVRGDQSSGVRLWEIPANRLLSPLLGLVARGGLGSPQGPPWTLYKASGGQLGPWQTFFLIFVYLAALDHSVVAKSSGVTTGPLSVNSGGSSSLTSSLGPCTGAVES